MWQFWGNCQTLLQYNRRLIAYYSYCLQRKIGRVLLLAKALRKAFVTNNLHYLYLAVIRWDQVSFET